MEQAEKNIFHPSKRVAILGANGFIGSSLVFYLMQMGYGLHLLIHQTPSSLTSIRGQIIEFSGSLENKESLVSCFTDCDAVFHLVGIIAETRQKTFAGTVIEGTKRVIEAAQQCGVKRIYYVSALGTRKDAESQYHQAKWEAEQAIVNSGLEYTIFRPSVVYGQNDVFINKITNMIRQTPIVPIIGDGLYKMQPVFVEELCALMADSTRRGFAINKIYEIGGPQQLTYLEIVDIIKKTLGIKKRKIHIPLSFARIMAKGLESIMKPAPLTTDQLKMMVSGSVCDQTIVEREFGVTFSTLESQISKYMEI